MKKIVLCPDTKIVGRPGEANHSIPGFRGGRDGGQRGALQGRLNRREPAHISFSLPTTSFLKVSKRFCEVGDNLCSRTSSDTALASRGGRAQSAQSLYFSRVTRLRLIVVARG